jgi:hypothetical protein
VARFGELRLTIYGETEGKVEPIMPEALPAPLIEYIKCDGQKQV